MKTNSQCVIMNQASFIEASYTPEKRVIKLSWYVFTLPSEAGSDNLFCISWATLKNLFNIPKKCCEAGFKNKKKKSVGEVHTLTKFVGGCVTSFLCQPFFLEAMMKFSWNFPQAYLTYRRFKKYTNYVKDHLSSADISIFSPSNSNFCYIKKYRHILHFNT